jgi:hypothetical protein
MFMKYAGMTMEERNPYVTEWANTIRVEEAPTASARTTEEFVRKVDCQIFPSLFPS